MEMSHSEQIQNCLNKIQPPEQTEQSVNDILLESLPSAIVLVDESGRILLCNTAFKRLIHKQDVIGLDLFDLISVETSQVGGDGAGNLPNNWKAEGLSPLLPISAGESEWLKKNLTEAFDTSKARMVRNSMYCLLNGDSELRSADVKIQPLKNIPSKGGKAALVIIDDTTEYVALERRLIRTEKLASVGMLSANLAHELNSPLDGALRYTNFLLEDIYENDPRRKYVSRIIEGLTRMSDIVKGVLYFSRQNPRSFKPTDIHQSFENTLSFFNDQIKFHRITVETKFDNQIPIVLYADIEHVFLNLIKNAIQAMPDGGKLRIETKLISLPTSVTQEISDWIEIEILDTGCGIPPELQDSIFAPFVTTKDVGEGTGLGLSICQGIVSRYNGKLDIRSKLQQGTTVTVKLPIARVS